MSYSSQGSFDGSLPPQIELSDLRNLENAERHSDIEIQPKNQNFNISPSTTPRSEPPISKSSPLSARSNKSSNSHSSRTSKRSSHSSASSRKIYQPQQYTPRNKNSSSTSSSSKSNTDNKRHKTQDTPSSTTSGNSSVKHEERESQPIKESIRSESFSQYSHDHNSHVPSETSSLMQEAMEISNTISLDNEMREVTEDVDGMVGNFRKEMMEKLYDLKGKVSMQCAVQFAKEKREMQQVIAKCHKQIDDLHREVHVREKSASQSENMMKTWSKKFIVKKREDNTKTIALKALIQLKHYSDEKKTGRKLKQIAGSHFNRTRKSNIFKQWRNYSFRKMLNTRSEYWRDRAEVQVKEIKNDTEATINVLRSEINQLQNKLETAEDDKVLLQEKLKKAFMRGVCALNMEAMSILKEEKPNMYNQNDQNNEQENNDKGLDLHPQPYDNYAGEYEEASQPNQGESSKDNETNDLINSKELKDILHGTSLEPRPTPEPEPQVKSKMVKKPRKNNRKPKTPSVHVVRERR